WRCYICAELVAEAGEVEIRRERKSADEDSAVERRCLHVTCPSDAAVEDGAQPIGIAQTNGITFQRNVELYGRAKSYRTARRKFTAADLGFYVRNLDAFVANIQRAVKVLNSDWRSGRRNGNIVEPDLTIDLRAIA